MKSINPLFSHNLPDDFRVSQRPLLNTEVEHYLCKTIPDKNYFVGVYSADVVPWDDLEERYDKRERYGVILNFDKLKQPGSHFVALACNEHGLFYYDPLGLSTPEFIEEVKEHRAVLWSNIFSTPHQNINSSTCGYFNIWFILAHYVHVPSHIEMEHLYRLLTQAGNGDQIKNEAEALQSILDYKDIIDANLNNK